MESRKAVGNLHELHTNVFEKSPANDYCSPE